MAAGPATRIDDVVVPEIFGPYTQQISEQKSRLIQSGLVARSPTLDALLAGGGLTFNVPSFKDLDDDTDRVSTDTSVPFSETDLSSLPTGQALPPNPFKTGTSQEIATRLNRNASWSTIDLTAELAGADPMDSIAQRVANYWNRRLQAIFIATWNGVVADNASNDSADYVNNVSGASFVDGTTNFSAEAFIDAANTMGDSMEDLTAVAMHSVVYARVQKNNLIDFIPDARGEIMIPTFLGREVIVDDQMPNTGGVYDTWLFGRGATLLGVADPQVPVEVDRKPGAGNGGGQEVLYTRRQYSMHPIGHQYSSTPASGGPSNSDLATGTNWDRVYPERKQIKFARLVTRES